MATSLPLLVKYPEEGSSNSHAMHVNGQVGRNRLAARPDPKGLFATDYAKPDFLDTGTDRLAWPSVRDGLGIRLRSMPNARPGSKSSGRVVAEIGEPASDSPSNLENPTGNNPLAVDIQPRTPEHGPGDIHQAGIGACRLGTLLTSTGY
jgi:hypothetical protein